MAEGSRPTLSTITGKVLEGMRKAEPPAWLRR